MARILVVGTYDSKSQPYGTLTRLLGVFGGSVTTMDVSVFASDAQTDISAACLASVAGHDHDTLSGLDRAAALEIMTHGAGVMIDSMVARREISGLVMMGGSNAAAIFTALAARLPTGLPKVFAGTFVSGDTRELVGARDVVLFYPVVDIEGSNSVLDAMIERVAQAAVAIMKESRALPVHAISAKRVAISMYGVTTPCAKELVRLTEGDGGEALVFHANGTGGRSIETFATEGLIEGLADITIAELANEVLGGGFPAGSDRMTGAAVAGIPQVIVPGALDMIAFGPPDTVPAQFADHQLHCHNALVTLVRTSAEDCRKVGTVLADRLGCPAGPTVLCVPLGGFSMLDRDGEVFDEPGARTAFLEGFRSKADPSIRVVTTSDNINDLSFAALVHRELVDAQGPIIDMEKAEDV